MMAPAQVVFKCLPVSAASYPETCIRRAHTAILAQPDHEMLVHLCGTQYIW